MKKRILSILLSIAMLAGLLPTTALAADADGLYIGGVALPSGSYYKNGGKVSDTEPSDWNARYDGSTLTIRNLLVEGQASSDAQESAGIYYDDYDGSTPLTLVIEGANSVAGGDNSSITGANASHGIYSGDALTIKGDGSLSVSGGTVIYAANSFGIYAKNNLMVEGGVINATGGTASGNGSSYGIGLFNSGACGMTVKGGTLNTTGGTASSGSSAGIYAAFDSQFVDIDGGILVATGGAGNNSYGIYNSQSSRENNTVTATGGILVARAGSETDKSKAIEGKLTMTGAKIAGGTAESAAVAIVPDSYTVQNEALINDGNAPDYTIDTDTAVVVTQGTPLGLITAGSNSSVTLNGDLVLINLQNKVQTPALHLGTDATVSGSGTLTAIGAPGQMSSFGISGTGQDFSVRGVTVIAIGSTASDNSYGIGAEVYVDVSENGSVIAIGGAAGNTDGCKSRGISGAVAADSGTINAIGGTAAASCGVFSDPAYSNSTVAVTGGMLNAVGGVSDDPSCGVSAPSVTVADAGMIHAVGRTYGLSAQSGSLAGGSFTGGTAAIQRQNAGSVSALLADGYGYYAGDSQLDGRSQTVGDSYQTITVKPVTPAVTEAQWGASADVLDTSGTLSQAFDANPAYIQLQSSVTLAAGITVTDGTTTLDLNGQTITGAADADRFSRGVTPITVEGGALTLIDTAGGGGIVGGNGGEYAGNALKVGGGTLNIGDSVSSGSFTLTGGDTSSASSGSSGKGLYIASDGEVVVKQAFSLRGGIKANSYDFALQSFGTLTGGSYPITATGGLGIYGGTATGLNATVTEATDALYIYNVTEVSITGGSYTGTRYGLWVSNSTSAGAVTISGGTFITTDLDDSFRVAIKNSGQDSYAELLAEGCFYTDDAANDTPIKNEGTLAAAKKLVVKTSAPAAAHSHDISVDCGSDSPVEFIEWKPGDFNGGFPSDPGSYVLADNVNIDSSETWVIGSGINLCLNGHTLTLQGSGDILLDSENSTLNICDCSEDGKGSIKNISSHKYLEGIEITHSKAKFNLYGGNIYIGSTYTGSDGYAYGVDGGSAYISIYGGSITAKASDNKAVALNISSDTPHFKIYGGVMTADAPEGKEEYGLYLPSLYSGWNSYSIEGGVFIGRNSLGIGDATNPIKVTGGIFSTDPTGVIDPSYTARVITAADLGYKAEYEGYYVVEPASAHTHSYTYEASGATITESCGCGHSATATISVPQPSYPHTGAAITPATVSYGGTSTWAGGDLTPAYENNTNVGEATAKIAIGGATASVTFTITAADPDTHTVTFNMNGHGTAIDPVTVSSGEKVTKPTDPTATGYTFDGWFKEQACTNEWDFDNDTVNGNTTLYAKWTAETYSVMLNANGGAISSGNVTSYTYGVGATLPAADDMAKDGHRFGGWYESADFSGSPVTTIPSTATGDKVYYAKWIAQHTVSGTITGKDGIQYSNVSAKLIALGGDTVNINSISKDSAEGVTPEVYTFSNVTVDAGQYNLVVTATDTTNNDKEVTVTALVDLTEQDATVTLALPDSAKSSTVKTSNGNIPRVIAGGMDQLAEETDIPDDASSITIALTVDEKMDDEIADDAEKIAAVAGGQTIDLYLDIQLQLFKDDDTTGTDLGSTNTQILELIVPADTGKTGLTVYRVHDGKAEAMQKDSPDANGEYFTLGDGFVTIYAKKFSVYALGYTPDDTYTITLDANGGTVNGGGTATLVTGADKKLSSLPTPTRSGSYTFDGWFTAASGGEKVTTDKEFASNQTIYAHWTYTGSTGDGGGYTPTYSITVEKAENGKVEANRSSASSGSTVTLTVTPEDGYVLDRLTVTDSRGNNIEATDKGNGTYTFKMPSRKVTVEAVFVPDGSFSTCTGGSACPIYPYTDADPAAWYHDGVHYCIENGLMAGYGNNIFKPDAATTRGMLAVMLWRLEGSPVVNYALNFEDVAEGQWYTEAIRWAVSEGIATGYGNGYFGTNDAITREQLAAMLWRYAGSPESSRSLDHFGDAMEVSGYAVEALAWANEQGIVVGVGNNTLSPQSHATRAQVATMLMRMVQATTK